LSREFSKAQKINRRGWPQGPWDNEPDFYEWTTTVGYLAYAARLDDGCWFGVVEAPYPTDSVMLMAFSHTIRDKSFGRLSSGLVAKSNQKGIGEFCYSMERYQSPIPREISWGEYKTLEDVKKHCEEAAQLIFTTHKEGTYVNYFQRKY
jgi:hypothetical protein